ncbi:MAG: hypothetical protein ACRDQA_02470 [Nocardioidaceae bacterium]
MSKMNLPARAYLPIPALLVASAVWFLGWRWVAQKLGELDEVVVDLGDV